ncbi:MAG: nucleotide sugar dehydrogenase [Candidatus Omnitrophota bacterium]|nr:nucleotide sugar dehydrogenase [Candidatus Omnitrophota bacterium]
MKPTVQRNVSVVGLGKLGFPFSVCLANKGFNVWAVDNDAVKLRTLKAGHSMQYEPGLRALWHKSRKRVHLTADYAEAIANTNITFVVVPTPSKKDGSFTSRYVLDACRKIGKVLKDKKRFHLVVITSTVVPGTVDTKIRSALEAESRKKCGAGFGLCYNPEFIALGSVIHDLYHPDFVLIGESDKKSGDLLSTVYAKFCGKHVPLARMNFSNAELTKLTLNAFVTMKISYANMIKQFCEGLPGGNVDVVTGALGLDRRIGSRYLKGGLGYGGPCFPRDNLALLHTAHKMSVRGSLPEATHEFNKREIHRLAKLVIEKLPRGGKVGILGLSYKPNTNVADEAQGVLLARFLARKRIPVIVYDPVATDNARKLLTSRVEFASSKAECLSQADIAVITTPWERFKRLRGTDFKRSKRKPIVIDCWRILDTAKLRNHVEYLPLGVGREITVHT